MLETATAAQALPAIQENPPGSPQTANPTRSYAAAVAPETAAANLARNVWDSASEVVKGEMAAAIKEYYTAQHFANGVKEGNMVPVLFSEDSTKWEEAAAVRESARSMLSPPSEVPHNTIRHYIPTHPAVEGKAQTTLVHRIRDDMIDHYEGPSDRLPALLDAPTPTSDLLKKLVGKTSGGRYVRTLQARESQAAAHVVDIAFSSPHAFQDGLGKPFEYMGEALQRSYAPQTHLLNLVKLRLSLTDLNLSPSLLITSLTELLSPLSSLELVQVHQLYSKTTSGVMTTAGHVAACVCLKDPSLLPSNPAHRKLKLADLLPNKVTIGIVDCSKFGHISIHCTDPTGKNHNGAKASNPIPSWSQIPFSFASPRFPPPATGNNGIPIATSTFSQLQHETAAEDTGAPHPSIPRTPSKAQNRLLLAEKKRARAALSPTITTSQSSSSSSPLPHPSPAKRQNVSHKSPLPAHIPSASALLFQPAGPAAGPCGGPISGAREGVVARKDGGGSGSGAGSTEEEEWLDEEEKEKKEVERILQEGEIPPTQTESSTCQPTSPHPTQ
ncbi:hypothetical protein JCM11641_003566 [Rhodosporidiobolus odoratus]